MERNPDHGINDHKQNDREEILQIYGIVAEKRKHNRIKVEDQHQQFHDK